ncbi:hypothetical protein CUZ56_03039 [Saezia sanguinis]|uniref:Uncharacterized protein n=1 Tax=Saezia sanguinis TaxID=1965230 RepID=A0A433S9I7_9BURK|nr:hypothetical protein CUZ56_03039 [Saezia sanguinis]
MGCYIAYVVLPAQVPVYARLVIELPLTAYPGCRGHQVIGTAVPLKHGLAAFFGKTLCRDSLIGHVEERGDAGLLCQLKCVAAFHISLNAPATVAGLVFGGNAAYVDVAGGIYIKPAVACCCPDVDRTGTGPPVSQQMYHIDVGRRVAGAAGFDVGLLIAHGQTCGCGTVVIDIGSYQHAPALGFELGRVAVVFKVAIIAPGTDPQRTFGFGQVGIRHGAAIQMLVDGIPGIAIGEHSALGAAMDFPAEVGKSIQGRKAVHADNGIVNGIAIAKAFNALAGIVFVVSASGQFIKAHIVAAHGQPHLV